MGITFGHAGENLYSSATVALATGVEVAGYELAKLVDGNPAMPFKIVGTALDITFDFGSARAAPYPCIMHHNLSGATARWQGHTADAWGTPDIDQALTVPAAADQDGYRSGIWLNGVTTAKRWWRLHITGNATAIVIGELFIGPSVRSITAAFMERLSILQAFGTALDRTRTGAALAYEESGRVRRLRGSVMARSADSVKIENWHQASRGRARPFPLVPDSSVNDVRWVRWATDELDCTQVASDAKGYALEFDEEARGDVWP